MELKYLMRISQIAAAASIYHYQINKNKFNPWPAQALVREEDLPRMRKLNTNVYVYGEGFQVDPT